MNHTHLSYSLKKILENHHHKILSKSILHSTDANSISDDINYFCIKILGSPVKKSLYIGLSVGASFGLVLQDGRNIFLKIHRPTHNDEINAISLESLTTISNIQAQLAEKGFPCPKVIHAPVRFGKGIATIHSFEDKGKQEDAHQPVIRRAMAETLARLIQMTNSYKAVPNIRQGRLFTTKNLYPTPHNALFNFENHADGAEWIDEIARRAKNTIQSMKGETVLGHADWSVKNMRFENNEVVMTYDWDSLTLEDELHLLGIASATFTATWDIETKITPSRHEAYMFVKDYEYFRDRPFTRRELEKISADATYCMAYTARCEYSIDPECEKYEGSFRQALEQIRGENTFYLLLN